ALMELDEAADVHVADAVTVREKERVAIHVLADLADTSAGLAVEAGVGEGNVEALFLVMAVIADLRTFAEAHGEVVVHGLVIQEIFFDGAALVAQAQNELTEAVVRVDLHDVPENGTAPDLYHGLGTELGLLAKTGAQSAAENHYFQA